MEQEGFITNAGPFVYMSRGEVPGTIIEFVPMPEVRRKTWAEIHSWSVDWDAVRTRFGHQSKRHMKPRGSRLSIELGWRRVKRALFGRASRMR